MIEAVCADQSCVLLPAVGECHGDFIRTDQELLSSLLWPAHQLVALVLFWRHQNLIKYQLNVIFSLAARAGSTSPGLAARYQLSDSKQINSETIKSQTASGLERFQAFYQPATTTEASESCGMNKIS